MEASGAIDPTDVAAVAVVAGGSVTVGSVDAAVLAASAGIAATMGAFIASRKVDAAPAERAVGEIIEVVWMDEVSLGVRSHRREGDMP